MLQGTRRLVGAACLATATTIAGPVADAAGPATEARCRRVKLDGTIVVTPKPRPGFKGTVQTSEGTFTMDLIFPEKGGEVLRQQSTVTLTRVTSHAYGGARQCRVTLPASAQVPQPFKAWAKLAVDEIVVEDGGGKVKSVQDQFDMMVRTLPALPPITYTVHCDGGQPGPTTDPVAIAQLVQVFGRTQYSAALKLNRIGDRRQLPNVDLFGSLTGQAEWEALETLVPCDNFQYK